jgi:hypothetical protein
MASIYETKMPAYLAMSRADLMSEMLSIMDRLQVFMQSTTIDEIKEDFAERGPEAVPQNVRDDRETLRIANNVLSERFQLHIHFTSEEDDY